MQSSLSARYYGMVPKSRAGQDGPKGARMIDYQIQPNTRRCAVTGCELKPGDRFYSVLQEVDGNFVRRDFSVEGWQGPPPDAFCFWSGRVPPQDAGRRLLIDDDLLADCFDRLKGETEPNRVSFRYVVALLLMRRKRLRFEKSVAEDGQEVLLLRCARTGTEHRVVNPGLSVEAMADVQQAVFNVLGWE